MRLTHNSRRFDMISNVDLNPYHTLYQSLLKVDPDFAKFFKINHRQLDKQLAPNAKILVVGSYHGKELLA